MSRANAGPVGRCQCQRPRLVDGATFGVQRRSRCDREAYSCSRWSRNRSLFIDEENCPSHCSRIRPRWYRKALVGAGRWLEQPRRRRIHCPASGIAARKSQCVRAPNERSEHWPFFKKQIWLNCQRYCSEHCRSRIIWRSGRLSPRKCSQWGIGSLKIVSKLVVCPHGIQRRAYAQWSNQHRAKIDE